MNARPPETEVLFLRPLEAGPCETHAWTAAQMQRELAPLMRARHGKGGVDVCVGCLYRWKAWADAERAKKAATPAGSTP